MVVDVHRHGIQHAVWFEEPGQQGKAHAEHHLTHQGNFNWRLGQKMFDRDGILTIGYCYPQMYMAERYNASGTATTGASDCREVPHPQGEHGAGHRGL